MSTGSRPGPHRLRSHLPSLSGVVDRQYGRGGDPQEAPATEEFQEIN